MSEGESEKRKNIPLVIAGKQASRERWGEREGSTQGERRERREVEKIIRGKKQ